MTEKITSQNITGIILAGGRGSRMGGVDKGLQNFNGKPLAEHILMRLAPQVSDVMVNANRNFSAYKSFAVSVWPDASADFVGPLSGFLVGLTRTRTPYLLTAPCDTPYLPLDLAERLALALVREKADIAMAASLQTMENGSIEIRKQPVICLIKNELSENLFKFIQSGGRKVDAWTSQQKTIIVPFDLPSDDPLAFTNVNTLDELHALEKTAP